MNRNAIEMAGSIGAEPSQLDLKWLSLQNIDLSSILENAGEEAGIENRQWQKLLVQAGSWILDGLDQKIFEIQSKVVEQTTAIELRKMFGIPLSLLAVPVFVELEKMELFARIDLQKEAMMTSQIWEQINHRVLYMVQLFLAEQINLVEDEEKAHQGALNESKKEADGVSALAGTMGDVENQFDSKLKELKVKKESLTSVFRRIGGNLVNTVERAFETTVFNASRQSTAVTAIQ
jgi:hypothetical protein